MDPNTTLKQREILVHDMCLRDGMHAKRHQLTLDEMKTLAKAMDRAGVPLITEGSEFRKPQWETWRRWPACPCG